MDVSLVSEGWRSVTSHRTPLYIREGYENDEEQEEINVHPAVLNMFTFFDGSHISALYADESKLCLLWWDQSTTKNGILLKGHTDKITCIAVSPNQTYIASGSKDRTVRIWIFVGSEGWELHTVFQKHEKKIEDVGWAPNHRNLFSMCSERIFIWEINNPWSVWCVPVDPVHSTCDLGWSPDSCFIAYLGKDKFPLRVWNTLTHKELESGRANPNDTTIFMQFGRLHWAPSGEYFAVSEEAYQRIALFTIQQGKFMFVGLFSGQSHFGHALSQFKDINFAWSPDSKYIASMTYDNDLLLWDVEKRSRVFEKEVFIPSGCYIIEWSHDSRFVAVANDLSTTVFDMKKEGKRVYESYTDILDGWIDNRRLLVKRKALVDNTAEIHVTTLCDLCDWTDRKNHFYPQWVKERVFLLMCIKSRLDKGSNGSSDRKEKIQYGVVLPRLSMAIWLQICQFAVAADNT